jgi:hypothetical protein
MKIPRIIAFRFHVITLSLNIYLGSLYSDFCDIYIAESHIKLKNSVRNEYFGYIFSLRVALCSPLKRNWPIRLSLGQTKKKNKKITAFAYLLVF